MFGVGLFVALLTGAGVAICGVVMMYFPPRKINPFYGYRTARACKNQRNWDFAQRHSARMNVLAGIGNVVVSGAVFAVFVRAGFSDSELVHACVALQLGLSIPTVLLAIVPTEIALKRFDDRESSNSL